ncbi:hypothetical protein EVA_08791 [gut metagenome]|uniref:Uncharacterized protein n=1 Tax=gut metagenome TaxID=749906 RepID=J9GSC2_9ZZZZ
MKTASAYIVYDALNLSLSVQVVGGALTQRKDALTGEFDPDRSMFPLMFQPCLMVKDPNHILSDGDHTKKLIECRWYEGTDNKGRLITADTAGYILGEYGRLVVQKNVEPDQPVNLFFSCAFIDARTGQPFRKEMGFTLDTVMKQEVNLGIEIDAANKLLVSPFKTHTQRRITATLRNGLDDVPDEKAAYEWRVQDEVSRQMRPITDDDPFYVSGQGTRTLVVDRRYIDKELVEVRGHLKAAPQKVVSAHTKMIRWYGRWEEEEQIVRGKFIRPETTEIEIKAIINTPQGVVNNPTDYFDITHFRTGKKADAPVVEVGVGESVVLSRSAIGNNPDRCAVFGCEVYERSALRPFSLGGSDLTLNGNRICIQVPIKK